MARNLNPKCKQCRRLGIKLCGKGERGDGKCALVKRNYPPGVHGPKGYQRITDYGLHLQEKQKLKVMYGVLERQLRKYFAEATKAKGNSGLKLIEILERRLDNVVYRLGLGLSRAQARQFVSHGLFLINGKKINVPSFQVRVGDSLTIRKAKTKEKGALAENLKTLANQEIPSWLNWDVNNVQGQVLSLPADSELQVGVDPRLVVEFYSK